MQHLEDSSRYNKITNYPKIPLREEVNARVSTRMHPTNPNPNPRTSDLRPTPLPSPKPPGPCTLALNFRAEPLSNTIITTASANTPQQRGRTRSPSIALQSQSYLLHRHPSTKRRPLPGGPAEQPPKCSPEPPSSPSAAPSSPPPPQPPLARNSDACTRPRGPFSPPPLRSLHGLLACGYRHLPRYPRRPRARC